MQSILHRLFWGLVLVGAGVVFLLNQTGAITVDIGYVFSHFWPVILILVGLQGMLLQREGGFFWNLVVIIVGVTFLGRNMDWFTWDVGDIFRMIGPLALILFGLNMIARGGRSRREKRREARDDYGWNPVTPPRPADRREPAAGPSFPEGPPPAPPLSDDPNVSFTGVEPASAKPQASVPPASAQEGVPRDDRARHRYEYREERRRQRYEYRQERRQRQYHSDWWAWGSDRQTHSRFIGDAHFGHDYWELKPMSVSHFIGDTTIDLTKAQIPLGETKIYVSCFIGDVKVYVPNDPGVGIQVVSSSLIGDVKVLDHKRGGFFNQMSVETPSYADTDKRVVLVASALIGDVRIMKVG